MTAEPQTVSDEVLKTLELLARESSTQAYCPYSNFRVGAAVLVEGGRMFAGCNVENASFGQTVCAERNAVFQAVASGHRLVRAVVVYTPTPTPTAPCGACRQVLNEFGPDAEVFCLCDGPDMIRTTLTALLPGAFGPKNLSDNAALRVDQPEGSIGPPSGR